jgi:hypothetical protein
VYLSSQHAPALYWQVYRCFESWTPGSDWSVALPEGEDALVVAAGGLTSSWQAVGVHGRHQQHASQSHTMVFP